MDTAIFDCALRCCWRIETAATAIYEGALAENETISGAAGQDNLR
jgi:hypothetical protein